MLIELEEPFKKDYKKGYLVINKEPRRNVILYNSNNDRSTISYARYLMSVKLGRYLEENEIVDHINGNQLDDRIENYEIVTNKENVIRAFIKRNASLLMVEFECGVCRKIFTRQKNKTHLIIKTKKSTYCSRKCAGKSNKLTKIESKVLREYRLNRNEYK